MIKRLITSPLILLGVLMPLNAQAQIELGESYVTCFPGVDNGKIDISKGSGGIIDTRNPGVAPNISNWAAAMRNKMTPDKVGLVFGIAIDHDPVPNIYIANSAAFGMNIVDAGGMTISNGQPGAQWMPGQFGAGSVTGSSPQGEPAIYKIDSATNTAIRFGTLTNDGPGFGNIAFNTYTAQNNFYVSDLSNGKIYHLDQTGGIVNSSTFDHGLLMLALSDNGAQADIANAAFSSNSSGLANSQSKWGVTQSERLVWGVGVHKLPSDPMPRLFYNVDVGVNTKIFSVALDSSGNISTNSSDIRNENVDLSGIAGNNIISDIAFSSNDEMLTAERGGLKGQMLMSSNLSYYQPHNSRVQKHKWSAGTWTLSPSPFYDIGSYGSHKNSTGGVDFTYGLTPKNRTDLNQCDARFIAMGDALRFPTPRIYGLQHSPVSPLPNVINQSYYIDVDGLINNTDKTQNGDVEVYRESCRDPGSDGLCNIEVSGPVCRADGKNVVTVTMTNTSGYTATGMTLDLPGAPAGTTYSTSISGNSYTSTIVLDGTYSGPLTIGAKLTGDPDESGMFICCEREIIIDVEACDQPCLNVTGRWVREGRGWRYEFTVMAGTGDPNYNPTDVTVSVSPNGATVFPSPTLNFTGGNASGAIRFNPQPRRGQTFTLTFNSKGGDVCCEKTVVIRYPRRIGWPGQLGGQTGSAIDPGKVEIGVTENEGG